GGPVHRQSTQQPRAVVDEVQPLVLRVGMCFDRSAASAVGQHPDFVLPRQVLSVAPADAALAAGGGTACERRQQDPLHGCPRGAASAERFKRCHNASAVRRKPSWICFSSQALGRHASQNTAKLSGKPSSTIQGSWLNNSCTK